MTIKDISGQRFGLLRVLSLSVRRRGGYAFWLCECDCGRKAVKNGHHLRNGHTRSCGCLSVINQRRRKREARQQEEQRNEHVHA